MKTKTVYIAIHVRGDVDKIIKHFKKLPYVKDVFFAFGGYFSHPSEFYPDHVGLSIEYQNKRQLDKIVEEIEGLPNVKKCDVNPLRHS